MKKSPVLFAAALLGSLFLHSFSFAQNAGATLVGKILNPEGQPAEFANILLLKSVDSAMVKGEIADHLGIFNMRNIPAGEYFLQVSYVGIPNYNSNTFALAAGQEMALPPISLEKASTELQQVTVTASRPIMELKPDKMVFNVDGSINAVGNTALELLRKAPGVVVDNNEAISVLGKNGVRVYIDGRESPLRGDDLAALLKTINSTEIDAIEIITNPSSRYEAEGNAGIINIRMKKDQRLGANATLNLGYAVGQRSTYNGSLSGNYRNKSTNLFGSYSYNDGQNINNFNLYREQLGKVFDQRNAGNGSWQSHNFKAGADFFLSKTHTLGVLADGYVSKNEWVSDSRTPILTSGSELIDSVLTARSVSYGDRTNLNLNTNYRFDDAKGKTFDVNVNYGIFRNDASAYQPNYYKDATEQEILQQKIYANQTPTDIDILTLKLDHERPFLKGKLGVGIKTGMVATDNTFNFFNVVDNSNELDQDRSNRFEYTENVNAGYVNYNFQGKKAGFQAGLRVEQTNSEGDLIAFKPTGNENVKRSYLDFFPSAGVTYQVNPKNSLQLTYSRRIDRPSYQDLNPFENKLDELTFEKGNPFLRPQYTNNFQLNHSYNYRFNTSLSYSRTTDLMTRITDTSGVNASFITWLNLAEQNHYSVNFSAPLTIKQWWSAFANLSAYHMHNKADYGDGKTVDLKATSFNLYSQHTFNLTKDLSLEVSGWYNSPGLWGGTFEMDAMWSADAGLQMKMLEGKGKLKLSVSDVFKTNEWNGTSRFGALFMVANGSFDSRRFRVNFSYTIGNEKVAASRRRNTGLEDEANRIKTGN